jgi:hypothetical protein
MLEFIWKFKGCWGVKTILKKNIKLEDSHNSQKVKATQVSINQGLDTWYIHTIEYYCVIKGSEILLHATK